MNHFLQQALAFFQNGQLDQAEGVLQRLVRTEPGHPAANHLLGVIAFQRQDVRMALGFLERALEGQPHDPAIHNNMGLVLLAAGENARAAESFEGALRTKPDYPEALLNLGLARMGQMRLEPAANAFRRALTIRPEFPDALNNLGQALASLGQLEEATACFERALVQRPDFPEARNNLGVILKRTSRGEEALAAFEALLARHPDLPEAHHNRGALLADRGRLEEAEAALNRALELRPQMPGALCDLGHVLILAERPDQALARFDQALALDPGSANALCGRAEALAALLRPQEALALLQDGLADHPEHPGVNNNLGEMLLEMGRLQEAETCFDRALQSEPGFMHARFNLSRLKLLTGDFQAGWPLYESRHHPVVQGLTGIGYPATTTPMWLGEPLAGKTLLLYREQGLGDQIQFARFAPLLAEAGTKVILAADAPLQSLFNSLESVRIIDPAHCESVTCDCWSLLMSLPLRMGFDIDQAARGLPYLKAEPEKSAAWSERLAEGGGVGEGEERRRPRVGLVWAGSAEHRNDPRRTLSPALFEPLLRRFPRLRFFSLQTGEPAGWLERLPADIRPEPLGSALGDFAETAGLLSNLDLLISVDTAALHLAGALEAPVWGLLPNHPDWRWMLGREDSPWYPSLRLFRSPSAGDWETVIAALSEALAQRFAGS